MTQAMSEYVMLQVLRLHRQDIDYRAQQARAEWREHEQKNAAERTVGILGFGTLGQDAGGKLAALGFDVAGWSRSAKAVPGFVTYDGADGLDALLARSEILVSLLPMTPETEGILDAALFARLPRGAALVNAGAGDIWSRPICSRRSSSGQISAAVLDVFRDEPLPRGASVLVSPAYHRYTACRGRDPSADRGGDHRQGDRRFRGRVAGRQSDRPANGGTDRTSQGKHMSMSKNPGLWIVILLVVVGWNLYDIFGAQQETPPTSVMVLNWVLVVCGAVGLIGAVMQLVQQKNRESA